MSHMEATVRQLHKIHNNLGNFRVFIKNVIHIAEICIKIIEKNRSYAYGTTVEQYIHRRFRIVWGSPRPQKYFQTLLDI